MVRVVGVRFRTAGKIYFFDPLQFEIKRGENVIVETARGIEFGTVVSDIREVDEASVVQPLKPILRIANQRDKDQEAGNKEKEKEAFKICQEKIRKHGLEMKLIDAEYTFDNNKVLFYFTADGRIDFRELVKDLAGVFKTRIELRQIGVRDETKIMGGIGICGRPLCCHSYLSDFIAVSIKMAKEQNLSLNPTKISGVCGRLMCCLKNEEETYEELNRRLPNVGDTVTMLDGMKGVVHSVNVLRQRVKVIVESGDDKEIKEFEVEQLRFHRHHGKKGQQNVSPEELMELEKLEKEEEEELEAAATEKEAGMQRDKGSRQNSKGGEGRDRKDRQQKGERQDRGDRQEKGERQDRGDRQEKGERQDRGDRQEKGERQDRGDRQEKGDRQPKGDRQGKNGRPNDHQGKNEENRQGKNRQEKGERQDRGDRQEKGERQDRGDRQEKSERQDRGDRQEKGERRNRNRHGKPEGGNVSAGGQGGAANNQGGQNSGNQGNQGSGNQEGGRQGRNRGNRFRDRNRGKDKQGGAKGEQDGAKGSAN